MSTTLPRDQRPRDPDELGEPAPRNGLPDYGSDEAPVLLQLPNLAPSSEPTSCEVTAPTDELAPVEPPAETTPPEQDTVAKAESNDDSTRERRQRRLERQRRKPTESQAPSWFRNIGQYAFAVVLASLIFAVFVMWKERHKDVSTNDSSPPSIDLPAWEEDPSVVLPGNGDAESIWGTTPSTTVDVPPSTASTETATPPGVDTSSAPGLGVPEFRLARQPKPPAASSPATPAYPDTGVGPITTGGLSNQPDTSSQWGDDSRFVPTRQAIRPPNTDQRSR